MLKSLRFIPLCVLIFSGYAFADSGSSYVRVIHNVITNHMGNSLDIYQGKVCSIKIGLSRDGTVLYAVDDGGDADFCHAAIVAIRDAKRFPPPSEQIYQLFRDFTLDFRL